MNDDLKQQVIDYSLKLNSTNLSPLRSGNLSVRAKIDNDEGLILMNIILISASQNSSILQLKILQKIYNRLIRSILADSDWLQ